MSKKLFIAAALVFAVVAGAVFVACHERPAARDDGRKTIYQCSMHPQIVSDKPGDCPICGMKLQPVEQNAAAPSGERKVLFYRNPMNPEATSPVPAKDQMGMDYVPVYEDEVGEASGVPGHAAVSITPERQQLIGVKTTKVARGPLRREIRAAARVASDPDLYAAITEYREAASGTGSLRGAALRRLELMGISEDEARRLADDPAELESLLLPGKTAWVYAEIYEGDSGLVRAGQRATVSLPATPEDGIEGRVASVDSVLNAESRTLRARIEVPSGGKLQAETFVNARIEIPLGAGLSVPDDAVLDTGERRIVFVKQGAGRFEPRAVALGRDTDGGFEVLSGLREGEEVVTSANFLVDSESRFKSAVETFSGAQPAAGSPR